MIMKNTFLTLKILAKIIAVLISGLIAGYCTFLFNLGCCCIPCFEDFSVYVSVFLATLWGGILGYMCISWWKNINFKRGVAFVSILFLFECAPSDYELYENISNFILSQSIFTPAIENLTRQTLTNARKSLSIYFKENEKYPESLDVLYEKEAFWFGWNTILPLEKRKVSHQLISYKYLIVKIKPNQKIQPDQITDKGGWIYSPDSGDIRINCSHKDNKGVPYYEW